MRTKNVQAELDTRDLIAVPRTFVRRDDQLLREGDILVSSANSWNLVGKCCFVPRLEYPAALGGFISLLRPNPLVADPKYLYRWLAWEETQREVRGLARQTTNIANLPRERFLDLDAPLPPLREQRRIAAILDEADALRRRCREALGLFDELLQATFLEMFGDPVTNPRGWPVVTVGEIVSAIESGWSPTCEPRPAGIGEWGVLKLGAVTTGRFIESHKALPVGVEAPEELEVQVGDVLFTRKNTHELVGAAAYVHGVRPKLLLPDLVFRLRIDPTRVAPAYLANCLMIPGKRDEVQALAAGSSGSMPGISKARLATVSVQLPPMASQARFHSWVEQHEHHRQSMTAAVEYTDVLFSSLLNRAFSGDL